MLSLILIATLSFPSHYCPEPNFQNRTFSRASILADRNAMNGYLRCIRGYMNQGKEAINNGQYEKEQVLEKIEEAVEDAERVRRRYDRR